MASPFIIRKLLFWLHSAWIHVIRREKKTCSWKLNYCWYYETKHEKNTEVLDRKKFLLVPTGKLLLASQNQSINPECSKNMYGTSQACTKISQGKKKTTKTWLVRKRGLSKLTPKWVILWWWKEEKVSSSHGHLGSPQK